ncbi:uncharacterized protein [Brachyistius frenatus]|uniref:uncharacterized protein n=1 Tax=Brachyistius frenatus TaxID=100188 RepID=UPI0037E8A6A1
MDPKSCYRVKWIKVTTDINQREDIFVWPNTSRDAKRVRWEADGNGQMCLFLTKLQKSDGGLYSYEIWQGWDRLLVKSISLRIKDCKILPAVKAAPSTPARLDCPGNITSGQQGPQNTTWAIVKGNKREFVPSERHTINGTSLAILSVTTSDSGWYRCHYVLGQTQRCFDINLLVQEENAFVATTVPVIATKTQQASESASDNKEEGGETLIAVVASLIFGVILIAALIGLFIHRRRNTQRATEQLQSYTPESLHLYESVHLPLPHDAANPQMNSLCQFTDGSTCTFHW